MPKASSYVSRTAEDVLLVQGNDYEVIGIEPTKYRVIDEVGRVCLLPRSFFFVFVEEDVYPQSDQVIPPTDWICQENGDGQTVFVPPEFSSPGFFQRLADNQSPETDVYGEYLRKLEIVDHQRP